MTILRRIYWGIRRMPWTSSSLPYLIEIFIASTAVALYYTAVYLEKMWQRTDREHKTENREQTEKPITETTLIVNVLSSWVGQFLPCSILKHSTRSHPCHVHCISISWKYSCLSEAVPNKTRLTLQDRLSSSLQQWTTAYIFIESQCGPGATCRVSAGNHSSDLQRMIGQEADTNGLYLAWTTMAESLCPNKTLPYWGKYVGLHRPWRVWEVSWYCDC